MKHLILIIIFSLAANASGESPKSGFTSQHVKVVSFVAPEWPEFTNTDGTGLYWELLRAIYEPEGVRFKHANVPWNRAMKMVTKYPIYDAIVGESLDTEESLRFPKYAIDVERMAALYLVDKGIAWNGEETLDDKTIGWMKDYELMPKDKRNFTLREFRSIDDGLKLLVQGKIDVLIHEWAEIAVALQEAGLRINRFEMHDILETDVYVGFSDSDLSGYLIEIYNRRIPELVGSGKLQEIYKKWDVGTVPRNVESLVDDYNMRASGY